MAETRALRCEMRKPTPVERNQNPRVLWTKTTLGTNHFGGRRTGPGRWEEGILETRMSTIWNPLFGVKEGDDDPAATSGGWQGGGYPTRMKPPCQFSHPAFTGKRVPVRSAYDC